jgi:hypothetical protein
MKNQKLIEKILDLLDDVVSFTARLENVTSDEWQQVDRLRDQITKIVTKEK